MLFDMIISLVVDSDTIRMLLLHLTSRSIITHRRLAVWVNSANIWIMLEQARVKPLNEFGMRFSTPDHEELDQGTAIIIVVDNPIERDKDDATPIILRYDVRLLLLWRAFFSSYRLHILYVLL
jgi:hypothetical protein